MKRPLSQELWPFASVGVNPRVLFATMSPMVVPLPHCPFLPLFFPFALRRSWQLFPRNSSQFFCFLASSNRSRVNPCLDHCSAGFRRLCPRRQRWGFREGSRWGRKGRRENASDNKNLLDKELFTVSTANEFALWSRIGECGRETSSIKSWSTWGSKTSEK